jgi:prepilin-type N-terminal cleavage/methylation domain-containing protein
MRQTTTYKNKAFTLIELMVVIAIIGILASIILASVSKARSQGRDGVRKQNLSQLSLVLETYYDANGHYPISTCISSPWWGCWGSAGETRLLSATYIPTMPQDPSFVDNGGACDSKGSYLYAYYSDNGQRYILATALENPPASSDPNSYTGNYGCTAFANWAITKGF